MLMTVDIGNTNMTIALFDANTIKATFRLTTKTIRTSDEYGSNLINFMHAFDIHVNTIEDVIISSVVPKVMHSFTNSIRKYIHKEPIIIGPGLKTGISIRTDDPRAVGADRIVDLAGCMANYGGNALVIDFGTATTYDYISEDGIFQYGVTAPGIEISAKALWTQAAKLPEIEIKKPDTILAKNTITSMQAGLVYGYIGQCEYIINEYKKALGIDDMKVIATGGLGRIICSNTTLIDIYDPDLTFKGLKTIYDRNK